MDFIEFLQNEEKYHREVKFVKNRFLVNKKAIYACNKAGRINNNSNKYDPKTSTDYYLKQLRDESGNDIWYIINGDYFLGYYFSLDGDGVNLKSKEVTEDDIKMINESVPIIKKNERKLNIKIAILCFIIGSIGLFPMMFPVARCVMDGVNTFSSCNVANTVTSNGTYYLKRQYSDSIDKSTYFELKNGEWKDESGNKGEYEISGNEITFYVGNSGMVFVSGTISDGKMQLKISSYSTLTYIKQ